MSGFLARMVARAQGRVAVVQPLVPARFAPGMARGAPRERESVVERVESFEDDAAPAPQPSRRHARAAALMADEAAPQAPAPALDAAARRGPRSDRPAPAGADDDAAPPALARRLTPRAVAPPAEPGRRADAGSPAPAARPQPGPDATLASPERARAARPRGAPIEHAELEAPRTAPTVTTSSPPIERPAPAPAPAPPVPPTAHPRPALVPTLSAARATPAAVGRAPARAIEPPAAAPVVHVSIGRIEVRALVTTAPPPRVSPPRPPAALSLDEYLRRKDGR